MSDSFPARLLRSLGPIVRSFPADLKRVGSSDLTVVRAGEAERAASASARPGVAEPHAQDYLAWRFSTLRVAVLLLAASFVVALVNWIVEVAGTEAVPGLRIWVLQLPGLAKVIAAGYLFLSVLRVVVAHAQGPGRGGRIVRRAWLVALALPLVALLVPWGDLMWEGAAPDATVLAQAANNPEALQRAVVGEIMRLALLVMVLLQALPALLSVFPGLFRAGLTLKTLLPGRGLGPGVAAAAGPLNALYLIVLLVIAQSLLTSWGLPVVALFLLGAPILTGVHCASLSRPTSAETASRAVARIRRISRALLALGSVGFVLILGATSLFGTRMLGWSGAMVGPFDLLNLVVNLMGMVLVFTVVAADGLVLVSTEAATATAEHGGEGATLTALQAVLRPDAAASPQPEA